MIGREEILTLLPHAGRMCLIEEVLSWTEDGIVCASGLHRRADHALRRGGELSSVHLIEYGAQAMAAHGALLARRAGASAQPGMLVAVRDFLTSVATLDDLPETLRIEAHPQLARADALIYRFTVAHAGTRIASGRVTVMLVA